MVPRLFASPATSGLCKHDRVLLGSNASERQVERITRRSP